MIAGSSSSVLAAAKHGLLPSEENTRWLKEFRLYLALVHYEPSILNQCMFDDTEKAVQGNQLLRGAAENALKSVGVCDESRNSRRLQQSYQLHYR